MYISTAMLQNVADINRRFDFLDTFMKEKLLKLDVIDKLNDIFEKELVEMKSEINEIKNIQSALIKKS
jgi:hypothetical protein